MCNTVVYWASCSIFTTLSFEKRERILSAPSLEIDYIYFLMNTEINGLRQRSKKMEGKAISRRQIRPSRPPKKLQKLGQFGTNFDNTQCKQYFHVVISSNILFIFTSLKFFFKALNIIPKMGLKALETAKFGVRSTPHDAKNKQTPWKIKYSMQFVKSCLKKDRKEYMN